ncbi:MAG: hypothetical protein C3F11_01160 [Methylocystaceae bacterium]|nr:MAG: hypothetical protein C3F11_01160 [Methylocystaceae bacterium]
MIRTTSLRGANTLALILAAVPASAQEALPDIEVASATRSNVKLREAPAAVDVVQTESSSQKTTGNAEAPTRSLVSLDEKRDVRRIGDALLDTPSAYFRGGAFGGRAPNVGSSTFSMRGVSGSSRTLFMIDGMTLNDSFTHAVNWASMDLNDAERVEVVPGAFSSLWGGDAMGGVVNVITKAPTKREFSGSASFTAGTPYSYTLTGGYRDRFDNGLGVVLRATQIASHAYVHENIIANATPSAAGTPVVGGMPILNVNGVPSMIIGDTGRRPWEQQNANLRLYYDYSSDTKGHVGVGYDRFIVNNVDPHNYLVGPAGNLWSGTGNVGGLSFSVSPTNFMTLTPNEQTTLRGFGKFETKLFDAVKLEANVNYADRTNTYASYLNASRSWFDGGLGWASSSPNSSFDANLTLSADVGRYNQLIVGASYSDNALSSHKDDTYSWRDPDTRVDTYYRADGHSTMTSVFIQDKVTPLKDFHLPYVQNLDLYFGGRYDMWWAHGGSWQQPTVFQPSVLPFYKDNPAREENNFSPKFSIVYDPLDWVTLRGSVGTAFHPPTLYQLYSRGFTTKTAPVGVRTTEADPNLKSERLFGWEIGGTFRLPTLTSVQLTYYENYLSDLIYQVPVIQGTTNDLNQNVNVGKAYVRGIEAVVRQAVTEEVQVYGTLSRQDNRVTQVDKQPQLVGKVLTDVPRIMFAFGAEWKWEKWAASAEVKYTGSTFSTTDTLNQGRIRGVTGAYDPYTMVNAKVSYKIDDSMTFSVSGSNLLNLKYYEYYLAPGLTITAGLSVKY